MARIRTKVRRGTQAVLMSTLSVLWVGAASAQFITSSGASPSSYSGAGTVITFTANWSTGNQTLGSVSATGTGGFVTSYTCSPQTSGNLNTTGSCSGTYTTSASDTSPLATTIVVEMTSQSGTPTTISAPVQSTYDPPAPADTTPPTITNVPSDITQSTDAGVATAVVSWTEPTYDDNVGVTSSGCSPVSGSTFNLGATSVTCTAFDGAGNSAIASFFVTVQDDEAPVLAMTANISTSTDPGLATANVTYATPTATDNVPGVTVARIAGPASGSDFPIGETTVTHRATDAAGNTDDKSFTVTVSDNDPPVFGSTQADINVETDFNQTSAVVTFSTPTASDNSGTVDVTQTRGPSSGSAFPVGTTLVEFTATDPTGLTTTLQFNVTVSTIPPGTVTFIVNSPDNGTVTFSSATAAFNTAVSVIGGTGSSGPLQVVPGNYTVTYGLPTGFAVTSASCSSASGTVNTATQSLALSFARGETYTCTLQSANVAGQTGDQIANFIQTRAQLIMGNRPDQNRRIGRINGEGDQNQLSFFGNALTPGGTPIGLEVTRNRIDLSFASTSASEDPMSARSDWDVWFEASFTRYETGYGEGQFGILHAGADHRLGQNAILGFGVQVDSIHEDVIGAVSTTTGVGWMVGPYYTARVGEDLYFDTSLSYGQATNEVSPLGTYTDKFMTERWLASIGLFGSSNRGNLNIQPNISINYFEETSEAYIDSLGVQIASQTTQLGDVELGSRFTWSDPMGSYSTYVEFDGIYTFNAGSQVASTSTVESGLRGRVGFGGTVAVGDRGMVDYGLRYDGLGDNDYEAISLSTGFLLKF
ncbi:HYR domain-containing protein [Jannaschia faecimaris]